MRRNSTRVTAFAEKHIYPCLKAVGEFRENYLIFENGRYIIYNDAIHEVPYYFDNFKPFTYRKHIHAKNNLLSLGLVRMVFNTLLGISAGCVIFLLYSLKLKGISIGFTVMHALSVFFISIGTAACRAYSSHKTINMNKGFIRVYHIFHML